MWAIILLLTIISLLLWSEVPGMCLLSIGAIYISFSCSTINKSFKILYENCKGKNIIFNRKAKSETFTVWLVLLLIPAICVLFVYIAAEMQSPVFYILAVVSMFFCVNIPIGIVYLCLKKKYRRKGYDFCYDEILLARKINKKYQQLKTSEQYISYQKNASAYAQHRRKTSDITHFTGNTGEQYEYYVASRLKRMGYSGVSVTQLSGDYGADIVAYSPEGRRTAIQCKKYSKPVGVSAIQQVVASKAHYGCSSAMVVTTSSFTAAAKQLAAENNVVLMENFR